jgi:hypothetical protein
MLPPVSAGCYFSKPYTGHCRQASGFGQSREEKPDKYSLNLNGTFVIILMI